MNGRKRIFAIATLRSRFLPIMQVHHFVVAKMNTYALQGDGMRELRWVALGFSAMLVLFSLAIMIVERTITAEAWALLLLAPVSAGFALTARNDSDTGSEEVIEWPEESDFDREKSVGDPADAGFDVPVL